MNTILPLVFLLVLASASRASTIRGAVSAYANSEYSSDYSIKNAIYTSGLGIVYDPGYLDDFDAYLALGPEHSVIAAYEWFSEPGVDSARVLFDLGKRYKLDAVALWAEEFWPPPSEVSFLVLNSTGEYINIFNPILPDNPDAVNLDSTYPASVYRFSPINARYFVIDFGQCGIEGCSLGEIAFSTTDIPSVPLPAAFWLFSSGLIGLFSRNLFIAKN